MTGSNSDLRFLIPSSYDLLNADVLEGGRVACRWNPSAPAIFYFDRPIVPGDRIELTVESLESGDRFLSSFVFGCTSCSFEDVNRHVSHVMKSCSATRCPAGGSSLSISLSSKLEIGTVIKIDHPSSDHFNITIHDKTHKFSTKGMPFHSYMTFFRMNKNLMSIRIKSFTSFAIQAVQPPVKRLIRAPKDLTAFGFSDSIASDYAFLQLDHFSKGGPPVVGITVTRENVSLNGQDSRPGPVIAYSDRKLTENPLCLQVMRNRIITGVTHSFVFGITTCSVDNVKRLPCHSLSMCSPATRCGGQALLMSVSPVAGSTVSFSRSANLVLITYRSVAGVEQVIKWDASSIFPGKDMLPFVIMSGTASSLSLVRDVQPRILSPPPASPGAGKFVKRSRARDQPLLQTPVLDTRPEDPYEELNRTIEAARPPSVSSSNASIASDKTTASSNTGMSMASHAASFYRSLGKDASTQTETDQLLRRRNAPPSEARKWYSNPFVSFHDNVIERIADRTDKCYIFSSEMFVGDEITFTPTSTTGGSEDSISFGVTTKQPLILDFERLPKDIFQLMMQTPNWLVCGDILYDRDLKSNYLLRKIEEGILLVNVDTEDSVILIKVDPELVVYPFFCFDGKIDAIEVSSTVLESNEKSDTGGQAKNHCVFRGNTSYTTTSTDCKPPTIQVDASSSCPEHEAVVHQVMSGRSYPKAVKKKHVMHAFNSCKQSLFPLIDDFVSCWILAFHLVVTVILYLVDHKKGKRN